MLMQDKILFDLYYCIKVSKKSILERYFDVLLWHYFVLIFLKSKFWRSLYNQDLKNATKMYKESIHDFEGFRKKVRTEEYEMKKVSQDKQIRDRIKEDKQHSTSLL